MRIYKSAVYDEFRCIASACPDSCCHEWSVSVDPQTAQMYHTLPGSLGESLRRVLAEEDGDTIITIENGRCPMWRDDGLCRIQAELGHDALCKTCRDFPRLTHDYGDFQEWGLELSCPEAARLILNSPVRPAVFRTISGGDEPDYDAQDMQLLLQTRKVCLELVLDQSRSVGERLALVLMYGYHAQSLLDGLDVDEFDADAALETAMSIARETNAQELIAYFENLEILTDRWRHRLANPHRSRWQTAYERLIAYFLERYWLQAVADFDLVGRVKLAVISCLVIRELGGDLLQTAQLYSKEIENDPDNVEAILDGAYTSPALTDDKLLGLLLK